MLNLGGELIGGGQSGGILISHQDQQHQPKVYIYIIWQIKGKDILEEKKQKQERVWHFDFSIFNFWIYFWFQMV